MVGRLDIDGLAVVTTEAPQEEVELNRIRQRCSRCRNLSHLLSHQLDGMYRGGTYLHLHLLSILQQSIVFP